MLSRTVYNEVAHSNPPVRIHFMSIISRVCVPNGTTVQKKTRRETKIKHKTHEKTEPNTHKKEGKQNIPNDT